MFGCLHVMSLGQSAPWPWLPGCDEVMTIDEFLSPVCTESPGMCKLDQESLLRPLSYHNQVIYARPVNNNTVIRHVLTSANIHFYLFAFIIQYPVLEDLKYLNIKNILRACKVCTGQSTWVWPRWWDECLCSKFRIPVLHRLEGKAVICAARFIRVIGFMVMVYCSQFVNSKNMEGWCLKRAGPFWKLIYKVITRTRPGLTLDTG